MPTSANLVFTSPALLGALKAAGPDTVIPIRVVRTGETQAAPRPGATGRDADVVVRLSAAARRLARGVTPAETDRVSAAVPDASGVERQGLAQARAGEPRGSRGLVLDTVA